MAEASSSSFRFLLPPFLSSSFSCLLSFFPLFSFFPYIFFPSFFLTHFFFTLSSFSWSKEFSLRIFRSYVVFSSFSCIKYTTKKYTAKKMFKRKWQPVSFWYLSNVSLHTLPIHIKTCIMKRRQTVMMLVCECTERIEWTFDCLGSDSTVEWIRKSESSSIASRSVVRKDDNGSKMSYDLEGRWWLSLPFPLLVPKTVQVIRFWFRTASCLVSKEPSLILWRFVIRFLIRDNELCVGLEERGWKKKQRKEKKKGKVGDELWSIKE